MINDAVLNGILVLQMLDGRIRCRAVDCGIALQVGRSRVRFPMILRTVVPLCGSGDTYRPITWQLTDRRTE